MNRRCNHRAPSQRGYALLVTLVMLALLAVILGGMARRSTDTALQARHAEQAMRQYWAELSCSYTLLATASERADNRLKAWQASQEDDTVLMPPVEQPTRQEVFSLELAGLEVWGRIDDEQAKINLNQRLHASPDVAFMSSAVVDEVLSPARSSGIQLTRRPFVEALGLRPLMSWQQMLPGYKPQQLLGIDHPDALIVSGGSQQAVVERVTLWGDGAVNIWTAEDRVVRQRLQGVVQPSTVEALLRLRAQEPQLPLGTLYENATEDRGERVVLEQAFTERSVCYSMWLATRPAQHQETAARWSLRVLENGGGQQAGRTQQIPVIIP